MSQCVAITKTGKRCSRIVKDDGNLCFQHKQQSQPAPKAQPPKAQPPKAQPAPKAQPQSPGPHGKKVKILKPNCLPDKYVWVVGKGCFEKLQTQSQPVPPPSQPVPPPSQPVPPPSQPVPPPSQPVPPPSQPVPPPSQPVPPPVAKPICADRTFISFGESPFIRNLDCRDLPLEQVRFILGPCVFFEFELGNRTLYLFGEKHGKWTRDVDEMTKLGVNKHTTLSFPAFVHSLAIQNPTKTYDLMFENVYFGDNFLDRCGSSTFDQISQEFENCIAPAKRINCPYKNLRAHYVDFRKYVEFKKIRKSRKDLPPDEIRSEITKMIKTPGKVLKQINAIKDDRIRNLFIQFFDDFIKKDPKTAGFSAMAVMDIYAMARVLRDFDSKKTNGVSSFQGTAQNVIYYAGAWHIKTFVIFLTDYLKLKPKAVRGFVSKLSPELLNFECKAFIDMGDMTKTSFV
jgi:hypothetical protein